MLPRIFHPEQLSLETLIKLDQRGTNHCLKVLRLKQGQTIQLFCGDLYSYKAELYIEGKQAKAKILEKTLCSTESPLKIHLGQGIARNDRMDLIIQKAVECGVDEITPLITNKSLVKIKADRLPNKMEHWQNIIISACEQSGRNKLPQLHAPQNIDAWLQAPFEGTSIYFDPKASKNLKSMQIDNLKVRVLLGPESGLSSNEENLANKLTFQLCSLGPRIFRTETATIAALSALQTLFGDL